MTAAGPKTDSTGQIQRRPPNEADQLVTMVRRMLPEIATALPKHVTAERMARIAMTAVRTNAQLAKCSAASFVGSVMQAAQLGLEPNTPLGHAYLVPYKGACTLIVGYQGFIELARRSGMVSSIYAYAVRQGDAFEYELGLTPNVRHKPSDDVEREDKPITHVYAVAAMRDSDERVFVVLTRAQIDARRKRSAASGSGPWVTDYEAMALKTAIRALWKWLPKSAELARAEAVEEAADAGAGQSSALDPVVAEAMARGGLIEDAQIVTEQAPAAEPQQ